MPPPLSDPGSVSAFPGPGLGPSHCSPARPFPAESWQDHRGTWVGFSGTYSTHGGVSLTGKGDACREQCGLRACPEDLCVPRCGGCCLGLRKVDG